MSYRLQGNELKNYFITHSHLNATVLKYFSFFCSNGSPHFCHWYPSIFWCVFSGCASPSNHTIPLVPRIAGGLEERLRPFNGLSVGETAALPCFLRKNAEGVGMPSLLNDQIRWHRSETGKRTPWIPRIFYLKRGIILSHETSVFQIQFGTTPFHPNCTQVRRISRWNQRCSSWVWVFNSWTASPRYLDSRNSYGQRLTTRDYLIKNCMWIEAISKPLRGVVEKPLWMAQI